MVVAYFGGAMLMMRTKARKRGGDWGWKIEWDGTVSFKQSEGMFERVGPIGAFQ